MSGGLNLAMEKSSKQRVVKGNMAASEEDFVEVGESGEVNGEQVEEQARRQQFVEFVRTGLSGVGEYMMPWFEFGDGELTVYRFCDGCRRYLGRWRVKMEIWNDVMIMWHEVARGKGVGKGIQEVVGSQNTRPTPASVLETEKSNLLHLLLYRNLISPRSKRMFDPHGLTLRL